MTAPLDLTGRRYGSLEVLKLFRSIKGQRHWVCRCDCGKRTRVRGGNLTSGSSTSCGCARNARPPLYTVPVRGVEMPVTEAADAMGVTPAYIYGLVRKIGLQATREKVAARSATVADREHNRGTATLEHSRDAHALPAGPTDRVLPASG